MNGMEMIKELLFEIDDEIDGAMNYVQEAVKHKDDWPSMAKTWAELAEEEMGHIERLQDAVDRAADRMRESGSELHDGVMEMIGVIRERDEKRVEGLRAWMEKYGL